MNSVTTLMASHTTEGESKRLHLGWKGTVRVFRQEFTLEDAIGSHACSLEEVHSSYRFAL
jgi:hypothetical protein